MGNNVDIALVGVGRELTVQTVGAVRSEIDDHVEAGCRRVVLNLAGCTYVDSAGMGLLIAEMCRLRRAGGMLSLVNVGNEVYRALRVLRLVDLMPVRRAGERGHVSELAPGTMPLWSTTLRVDGRTLSDARCRVGALLEDLGFSDDDAFDMELACGEALGNAWDHASDDHTGCGVLATVTAYPDRVVVDVEDHGCGFELGDDDDPPEARCAERGRGIRLMRLLVDSVSIRRRPQGTGTLVRLVKLRPWAQGGPDGTPKEGCAPATA